MIQSSFYAPFAPELVLSREHTRVAVRWDAAVTSKHILLTVTCVSCFELLFFLLTNYFILFFPNNCGLLWMKITRAECWFLHIFFKCFGMWELYQSNIVFLTVNYSTHLLTISLCENHCSADKADSQKQAHEAYISSSIAYRMHPESSSDFHSPQKHVLQFLHLKMQLIKNKLIN